MQHCCEMYGVVAAETELFSQVSGRLRKRPRDLHDIQLPPELLKRSLPAAIQTPRHATAAQHRREPGPRLGVYKPDGDYAVGRGPCLSNRLRSRLRDYQLEKGRRVEIRDQRRCSLTRSLTVAPRGSLTGLGMLRVRRRARETSPVAISSTRRSWLALPWIGTTRAMGWPCSVTITSPPLRTIARYRLKLSFRSRTPTDRIATFIV